MEWRLQAGQEAIIILTPSCSACGSFHQADTRSQSSNDDAVYRKSRKSWIQPLLTKDIIVSIGLEKFTCWFLFIFKGLTKCISLGYPPSVYWVYYILIWIIFYILYIVWIWVVLWVYSMNTVVWIHTSNTMLLCHDLSAAVVLLHFHKFSPVASWNNKAIGCTLQNLYEINKSSSLFVYTVLGFLYRFIHPSKAE